MKPRPPLRKKHNAHADLRDRLGGLHLQHVRDREAREAMMAETSSPLSQQVGPRRSSYGGRSNVHNPIAYPPVTHRGGTGSGAAVNRMARRGGFNSAAELTHTRAPAWIRPPAPTRTPAWSGPRRSGRGGCVQVPMRDFENRQNDMHVPGIVIKPTSLPIMYGVQDCQALLRNKFVVVIGDSVQRQLYKDIVKLLQTDDYLTECEKKAKGEGSHCNDRLVCRSDLHNGSNYFEVRQYRDKGGQYLVRFYFVTRCYDDYIEKIFDDWQKGLMPDIIIMNSGIWDMTRYGIGSKRTYMMNLDRLFTRLFEGEQRVIDSNKTMFLWHSTLPMSADVKGGVFSSEVSFMCNDSAKDGMVGLRHDVLKICAYIRRLAKYYRFGICDGYSILACQAQWREKDGIHWNAIATRYLTSNFLSMVGEVVNSYEGFRKRWDKQFFES